jgi:hypothetical protein
MAPNYLASLKALQEVQQEIWPLVRSLYETKDASNPEHGIIPGGWVWVKRHRACTLEERWKGPYIVILVTPTALKVDGIGPWVHHSHARQASQQEQEEEREWITRRHPDNPLKLKLIQPRKHRERLSMRLSMPPAVTSGPGQTPRSISQQDGKILPVHSKSSMSMLDGTCPEL